MITISGNDMTPQAMKKRKEDYNKLHKHVSTRVRYTIPHRTMEQERAEYIRGIFKVTVEWIIAGWCFYGVSKLAIYAFRAVFS